jgi:hypothetical protein
MCRKILVEKEDKNHQKKENVHIVKVTVVDTRFVRVRLIFD